MTPYRFILILTFFSFWVHAQVGIGTNLPDDSAILHMESTEKGLLIPNMSTSDRDDIDSPAESLLIYNTDESAYQYFSNGNWIQFNTAIDCNILAFPDVFNINLDVGSQHSSTINLNYPAGTAGNISTSLVFATPGFAIVTDNITNNNTNQPANQEITFTLDSGSTVSVGDIGQAIFQVSSDCGSTRFITFNITVTGCDFTVTPETNEFIVQIPSTGMETITVDYFLDQNGTLPGNISLNIDNTLGLPNGNPRTGNSPCGYPCNTSFTFDVNDQTIVSPGTYTYILDFVSDCGFSKQETLTVIAEPEPRDCNQILRQNSGASSGEYLIDIDGPGGLVPMQAYCDMVTDGGGWTLVLNYYHRAGTNPNRRVLSNSLPLFDPSSAIGDDQSLGASIVYWGHASNDLLNNFDFSEVRFFGESSGHPRTLHFKHNQQAMINYFKTGSGSIDLTDLRNNFTPFADHSAVLPFGANARSTNQGNNAMLNAPFIRRNTNDWRIRNDDWEMDDNPNDARNSTIHQIWIR